MFCRTINQGASDETHSKHGDEEYISLSEGILF